MKDIASLIVTTQASILSSSEYHIRDGQSLAHLCNTTVIWRCVLASEGSLGSLEYYGVMYN